MLRRRRQRARAARAVQRATGRRAFAARRRGSPRRRGRDDAARSRRRIAATPRPRRGHECDTQDSLLDGFVDGRAREPVGAVVLERLRKSVLSPIDVAVDATPLRTTGQVETALLRALAANDPDAVVVLAGTNDLWRGDARAILASLERQYAFARDAGVGIVVGLTLPRFDPRIVQTFSRLGVPERVERTRATLNDEVRAAARESYRNRGLLRATSAPRLVRGISASRPRRRRDVSPRNIHVVAEERA